MSQTPQFAKYTNGQTALDFKKNGTGLAYYPSGKVAVAVTSPHGGAGRYYNFYLDRTGLLVASFNNGGIGFVSYSNGQPRLNVTGEGGTVVRPDGQLEKDWLWITNLDRMKFKEPIELRISTALTVCVRSQTNIKITFQSFTSKVFDVGLPAKRGKTGKSSMTFFERLADSSHGSGSNDLEKVQDMNWSLPRLSVSGRETVVVLQRQSDELIRGIGAIRDNSNTLLSRIASDEMKSSITKQTRAAAEAVYEMAHGNGLRKADKFGEHYTSTYKQTKRKSSGLVNLPILSPKKLDDFVNSAPSKRLVVVVMISDKYSESRPAAKMVRWAATGKWKEERAELKKRWNEKAGQGRLLISSSTSSLSTGGKPEKQGPRFSLNAESLDSSYDFAIVECSKNKMLEKQYNFPAYPMFFFFMGGRIVFAGTRFHRFGTGQDDFYVHLSTMLNEGLQGHFLPEDFKF